MTPIDSTNARNTALHSDTSDQSRHKNNHLKLFYFRCNTKNFCQIWKAGT